MSRRNSKKRLRNDLWWQFIQNVVVTNFTFFVALRWFVLYYDIRQQRYLLIRFIVISKFNWIVDVFFELFNTRFRKFVRINRETFKHVFRFIENDVVFQNNNYVFQLFVQHQLIIVFYKLKHEKNNIDFMNCVNLWKIFENYVFTCIKRVILILCKKRNFYVKWFDAKQRKIENIKNDVRANFLDCVNKTNDIDIVLNKKFEKKIRRRTFFQSKKTLRNEFINRLRFQKDVYLHAQWLI